VDLLDRLLIVTTSPYSEEEMRSIIGIRVRVSVTGAARQQGTAAKADVEMLSKHSGRRC
jgi:DNA helicase TIP49 (TBP-interacting protein)